MSKLETKCQIIQYRKDIRTILFDMIGVLLFRRENYQPDQLIDEIDFLVGQVVDDNAFKAEILKRFRLSGQELEKIFKKIANKYEPFKPLWELLPELKKRYKLGIINNGTALTLPYFDAQLDFDKYFNLFVSSAIEGIKKPDGKIFLITANRLNVAPRQCLFMDDLAENIEGARKVGMRTILWENKEQGFKKFIKLIGA